MNETDVILEKYLNNEYQPVYTTYTPDAVIKLLDAFDNPQHSFRSIHIAGTNGKGSAAFYTEKIFREAEYSTGLFMSPHLASICERIRLNGELISEKEFAELSKTVQHTADAFDDFAPTFFDMVTVIAFLCFKKHNVDIAIIETGLGGRYDSTNALFPLCSIITSVSLDHTAILGDSVESIAKEKAGIIKRGVPLITGCTERSVVEILKETCREESAPFYSFGNEFKAVNIKENRSGYTYDLQIAASAGTTEIKDVGINSPVIEQIINSSCALTAATLLNSNYASITPTKMAACLGNFSVPGRFQILNRNPFILFDPAHNPAAMVSLMRTIASKFPDKQITAIVSFMADKDYESMISLLADTCGSLIYYQLDIPRAYKPDASSFSGTICSSTESLSEEMNKNLAVNSIFLFTGSFRLFPAAKEISEKFGL